MNFQRPDFTLDGRARDTLFLLYGYTEAAQDWIKEHLPPDAVRFNGNAVAIEHRYVTDIANGITADGLSIQWRIT